MKRFWTVFAVVLMAGWAAPVFAADDALSIEANEKYLAENKDKKGVITPS